MRTTCLVFVFRDQASKQCKMRGFDPNQNKIEFIVDHAFLKKHQRRGY